MTNIGLISDTHSYFDENIIEHFKNVDEIWHIGDFGNQEVIDKLAAIKPLKGVYGNIDDKDIQQQFPEQLIFNCEKVKVMMQHIGGYLGKYAPKIKSKIKEEKIQLFLSGHSHILKVMYDKDLNCLHINPGAAGKQGWHTMRTLITISINENEILNCKIIELGKK